MNRVVEYETGNKFWCVEGIKLSEEEFNRHIDKNSCAGKVITIEGKQYTLTEI
jgi:hypothetical protein